MNAIMALVRGTMQLKTLLCWVLVSTPRDMLLEINMIGIIVS